GLHTARDYPIPASPEITTRWPFPLVARCQASVRNAVSRSLPRMGSAPAVRPEMKRLSMVVSLTTFHIGTSSRYPLTSCSPTNLYSKESLRQPMRYRPDKHATRFGERLKLRRQVRRVANDSLLGRDARSPGSNQPGRDANA